MNYQLRRVMATNRLRLINYISYVVDTKHYISSLPMAGPLEQNLSITHL